MNTPRKRDRIRRGIATSTIEAANPPRLLLAAKTALAVVLAWYLAPLIPFAEDQYSYYAPLGALVTMYPTIARSARAGAEALLGLALGIALGLAGLALLRWGLPGGVVLTIVIGAGVLVGGIRLLGIGSEWVAIAGLFVLLIGGGDAEIFSVSYLVSMAFGVLVGIAVNLVIVPPLYLRRAGRRLSALREVVSGRLQEMADAVDSGNLDADRFRDILSELAGMTSDVTEEVREADESGRGNPRGRRHTAERDENAKRLRALERTTFLTRALVDVLLRMAQTHGPGLDTAIRADLAKAIRRVAELVAAPVASDESPDRLDAAIAAVNAYEERLEARRDLPLALLANDAAALVCLQRVIDASRPVVRAT